ncbi:MAG: O-antigen ligase family protein [Chloroflexi bacterium]|nr:O-antigen ligase family protein [Chloroflexota bacterium]
MITEKRARWLSLSLLILAALALLGLGGLRARQTYLLRGIPAGLPGPIAYSGPRLGLNVALEQYDDAALAANLEQIAALGVSDIKQTFTFSEDFDWAAADRLATAVLTHPSLTLTPLLDGDPANNFAPPADPAVFAAWAGQFAARYGDQIQAYIIWDEPNLTSHWGNQPVNAAEYAALLTAASAAIRAADATAVIIAAPLAPTSETGPQNLADHLYLQQLYEEGAANAFDVAAGKPYGFDSPPDDRRVDNAILNFSRFILLREVMERNGDGDKALWAGNWGWNSLPPDWTGAPSVWGQVSAQQQADWTAAALRRAQTEWPWAGVLFLENWEPAAEAGDARWGFSVKERGTIDDCQLSIVNCQLGVALPGFRLARPDDPAQVYVGGWRFSPEFGADISQTVEGEPPDRVTFTFWGTDAGLRVRRANFRARLYVTIDGRPANALPHDENGAALVLTAADPAEDYIAIEPVATGLEPGVHVMEVVASRGWDQWALNGFSVGYFPPDADFTTVTWLLGITAVLSLIASAYVARRAHWGGWLREKSAWYARFSSGVQVGLAAALAALVTLMGWLTWGQEAATLYRRLGDGPQLGLTAVVAALFYVAPSFYVYIIALAALFVLIALRPAWGVVLIAFTIPFYVPPWPKPMFQFFFSPVEILTAVTFGAFLLRKILECGVRSAECGVRSAECGVQSAETSRLTPHASRITHHASRLTSADYAVLAFALVATASLLFTERLDVATNEWRMVIIEPILFYVLLRGVKLSQKEMWAVLDAFVLSGVAVALFGLWQVAFDRASLITAEGGLLRIRSIYGSPNNLALYLGRILPLALAMLLLGKENGNRRWWYGVFLVPMGLAVLLTFSKGALLLGLPAAFLYVFWRWQQANGRRTWPWVLLFGGLGTAVFLAALQIPQLAGRLDLNSQTGFFRLNLWRASLNMIADHPWLGVGLDNFLYAHRGRYILDAAWQEPNLNHPHNIVLDFATRLGLLGLLAGGWLIGEAGFRLWRLGTTHHASRLTPHVSRLSPLWLPVAVGLGGGLISMVMHGLVDHSFFLTDLAYAFYMLLGTAVWLQRNGRFPFLLANSPPHD